MAKSNFVHHRNANDYYACSCSSRCTSIGFDCPWKNFPVSTMSMTISSPGRDSERFFVCLFVCLCLPGALQLKHLHLQLTGVECTTSGCLLAAPRREGTRQQYPRQYQNPSAPHLFTNIFPKLYIFCLTSFPFGGGTVLFFFWFQASWYRFFVFLFGSAIVVSLFWFQASSYRRIYWGIIGWAYKSMLLILPATSFFEDQCIFSSFL